MIESAWSWQCEKCGRFLDWHEVFLVRIKPGVFEERHGSTLDHCGGALRVELRSESESD